MTIRPKAGQSWFNVGTRMLAASNGFEKLSDCRIFIRQCVWSVGASLSLLNIVYIRLQQFSKLFILQTSVSSRWESSPPFLADEVKWKVRPSANCQKLAEGCDIVFLLAKMPSHIDTRFDDRGKPAWFATWFVVFLPKITAMEGGGQVQAAMSSCLPGFGSAVASADWTPWPQSFGITWKGTEQIHVGPKNQMYEDVYTHFDTEYDMMIYDNALWSRSNTLRLSMDILGLGILIISST